MKAIICAAGIGKRLFPLTQNTHKALLPLGDKTFLEHILNALSACSVQDVVIIVGYRSEDIQNKIGVQYGECRIVYVHNKDFETTNNMYSLWCARSHITDGMIFFNADMVFHISILKKILASTHENSFILDMSKQVLEGVMKAHVANGKLIEIGKKISKKPYGESFGIYRLSQKATEKYFKIAGTLIEEGGRDEDGDRGRGGYKNASFVVPLQKMAHEIPIMAVSPEKYPWVEVDTLEDYERAQKMIDTIVE